MFSQGAQPFGQSTGLSFGQTQGTGGSLFGGGASTGFGGGLGGAPSGFGQPQQQIPQTPIFGQASQPVSGFGGPSASGGLFGQSQTQSSGFGATSGFGAFGGGGNAPVNQGAGVGTGGFSSFSQAAQKTTFGAGFGQTTQGLSGGFGQTGSQTFGGGGFGQGFAGQQQQQQQPQAQAQNKADQGFYKIVQPQPTVSSWGFFFQGKTENINEAQKGNTQPQGFFHNIRVEPNFAIQSLQMQKVMDLIIQKSNGAQQPQNYEFLAMQEFNQIGPQKYCKYQQIQSVAGTIAGGAFGAGAGVFSQPAAGSGGLFGQSTSGFGQTTGFGQSQGIKQGGGLFGQSTPAFGQTQGLGTGGGFGGLGGQASTAPGGGLFGAAQTSSFQNQPLGGGFGQPAGGVNQSTSLFGGAQSTFGQPVTGGGGLFGQQQTQPQGGGLFGQAQQPKPFGAGGFGQTATSTGLGGGGGLFGQQQQQPSGALFGQPQPQSQPQSLFGGGQQQPQSQSLFGQSQTSTGGGGLFGQQQPQQQTTSLFGGTAQQQPTQTPSLFGGAQTTQPQGGGLFGSLGTQSQQTAPLGQPSTGQAAGGGLFGGGGTAAGGGLFGPKPTTTTTSLFGGAQQQQTQPSTSLFGGAQQQQPTTGVGLFGAHQQQPAAGGGLFGAAASTGQPSLFGGAQTAGQGGLFGKQAPTTSSLFGQSATQQQPSLFGQPSATISQTPSLFGATAIQQTSSLFGGALTSQQLQQPQLQQQSSLQSYNPYAALQDPFNLKESFLSQESPLANVEEELKKLKEQALKNQAINPYKDISLSQGMTKPTPTSTTSSLLSTPSMTSTIDYSYTYQPPTPDEEEQQREDANRALLKKYQKMFEETQVESTQPKQMFTADKGYTSSYQQNLKIGGKDYLSQQLYGGQGNKSSVAFAQPSFSRDQSKTTADKMRENQEELRRQRYVILEELSQQSQQKEDTDQQYQSKQQPQKDIITITINIPEFLGRKEKQIQIKIHNSRDVSDIYTFVDKYLKDNYQFNEETHSYLVLYKNHVLNKVLSLKEAGIQSNCQIYIAFESLNQKIVENFTDINAPSAQEIEPELRRAPSSINDLAPASRLPKKPKAGYQISPSEYEIPRMTLAELQRVKDFTISNQFGSIMFIGKTDLADVDLERDITIVEGSAEVYHDEDVQTIKPPVGQKLNKPAIITLKNIDIPKKTTYEEKVEVFKRQAAKQDSEFISYNMEKKELKFKVNHFTKYQFDDDEEIQDHAQQEQQQQKQQQKQQDNRMDIADNQSVISDDYVSHHSDQQSQDQEQINTYTTSFRPTTNIQIPSTSINKQFGQKGTTTVTAAAQKYEPLFATQPAKTIQVSQQIGFGKPVQSVIESRVFDYEEPLRIDQQRQQQYQQQTLRPQEKGFKYVQRQPLDERQMDYDQASDYSNSRKRIITIDEVGQQSLRGEDSMMLDESVQTIDLTKRKRAKPQESLDIKERQRQDQVAKKAQEISDAIKKKEIALLNTKRINREERLSPNEAMSYLESIGIKQPQKNLVRPQKLFAFKPQFRSDGSLITLKANTNQINVTQLPVDTKTKISIEENHKTYEKVTDILIEQGKLSLDNVQPYLGQKFENLKLGDFQSSFAVGNYLVPQSFDDPYFEKLMSELQLPHLQFKENPTELFELLEALAKHLIKNIQLAESNKNEKLRFKLQQEFYVICVINALFCNPCIHLIQLHYKFTGIRNYDKAKLLFGIGGTRQFQDGYTFEKEKQRRNALTEVIRFICQQEFPVPANLKNSAVQNLDNIYSIALHHLFNGDLKQTLEHLNSNQKHKMALYVAQGLSSTTSQHLLKQQLIANPNLYQKFNSKAKDIISFLTGEINTDNLDKKEWIRILCYYLLVKIEPNVSLTELLQQFDSQVYQKIQLREQNHSFPLIYLLIKLYNSNNHKLLIEDYLSRFNRITPVENHSIQDNRIQFLTILIFYNLQRYYSKHPNFYQNKYKSFFIGEDTMTIYTLKYAQQLLRYGDWKQALLISQIIPNKSIKIKKVFVTQILSSRSLHFIDHENSNMNQHIMIGTKLTITTWF